MLISVLQHNRITLPSARRTDHTRCSSAPKAATTVRCTARQEQQSAATPAGGGDNVGLQRRHLIFLATASAAVSLAGGRPAFAGIVEDAAKSYLRPDLGLDVAVVNLLDARGTLMELKALAATAENSDERFRARRLLPGMAKRLRELGPSVPPLVALTAGGDKEDQLPEKYGGTGGNVNGGAVPIYTAIGNVITISGRTIRKEAQADPARAVLAIDRIDDLLASLPQDLVQKARGIRAARLG